MHGILGRYIWRRSPDEVRVVQLVSKGRDGRRYFRHEYEIAIRTESRFVPSFRVDDEPFPLLVDKRIRI
jgi:hypothetical protein